MAINIVVNKKAYVFRRNYDTQKWEKIAGDKAAVSEVRFVKAGSGQYFIRVSDGSRELEYPVTKENAVTNSGAGFLQVPLPDRQELYGIKFTSEQQAEAFFRRITSEMNIPYPGMTLPPGRPGGMGFQDYGQGLLSTPAELQLPDPVLNYQKPKPPSSNPSADVVDFNPMAGSVAPGLRRYAEAPYGGMEHPSGRQIQNEPPVVRAFAPQVDRAEHRPRPQWHQPEATGWSQPPQPVRQVRPEPHPQPPVLRRADPLTSPLVHDKTSVSQDIPGMVNFLMKAINGGMVDAAKEMVSVLATLNPEKRKFNVAYDEEKPVPNDDDTFDLDIQIEFQASHRKGTLIYVPVRQDYTIRDLQLLVEHQFHLPGATQNWIIGPQLVKQTDLSKTLQDYEITTEAAKAGKAKVFLYVINAKKANVTQGALDAVQHRKRQQEEAVRQVQLGTVPESIRSPPGAYFPGHEEEAHIYGRLGNRGFQAPTTQAFSPPSPQRPVPAYAARPDPHGYPQPYYQEYGGGRGGGGAPVHSQYHAHQDPPYYNAVTRGAVPGRNFPPSAQQQASPLGDSWGPEQLGRRAPTNGFLAAVSLVEDEEEHIYDTIPAQLLVDAPPPPAPPKKEQVGWACKMCTFINPPRRPGCKQCGSEPPDDYVIPEDAPLDEEEAKIEEEARRNEQLFKELQEQELRQQQMQREKNYRALLETEEAAAITNVEEFDCPICITPIEAGGGVVLRGCLHQVCKECLRGHVINCMEAEVKCPFQDNQYACDASISEREIREVVSHEELEDLYRRALRQAENAAANSFHCRTPNCEGFCFYEDEVNEFNCPVCAKQNCLLCKAIHEGQNCQEYQDEVKRKAANDAAAKATQGMLEELVRTGDAMHCPSCKIIVQKKDGCDWIRCSMCKTEICWATKGPRWGPKGKNDTSGGCKCRVGGKKCHPLCRNCH